MSASALRAMAAEFDRRVSGPEWPGLTGELEGARFGSLTVEAPASMDGEGYVRVTCRCECGRVAVRRVVDLTSRRAEGCRVCTPPPRRKPPSKRIPRSKRDPAGWEAEKARSRERRRRKREEDPAYRAREAEYARAYRRRRKERAS